MSLCKKSLYLVVMIIISSVCTFSIAKESSDNASLEDSESKLSPDIKNTFTHQLTATKQDKKTSSTVTLISGSKPIQDQVLISIPKKMDELLEKLDSNIYTEPRIINVEKRVESIAGDIEGAWKGMFETTSAMLGNLIGLTTLFITSLGVVFAILAFLGFKSINEIKKDITNDLTLKHNKDTQDLLIKHQDAIKSGFTEESSKLRDEINSELRDLALKVDQIYIDVRMLENNEKPVAASPRRSDSKPDENAFD